VHQAQNLTSLRLSPRRRRWCSRTNPASSPYDLVCM
jgi:hypothetical protein